MKWSLLPSDKQIIYRRFGLKKAIYLFICMKYVNRGLEAINNCGLCTKISIILRRLVWKIVMKQHKVIEFQVYVLFLMHMYTKEQTG